jgi:hypothetical protein
VIKLIAPKIEEIPAKCREKIVRSTDVLLWKLSLDNGGYTVQPVPAPVSVNEDIISREIDGGNNQNLILLSRGNAMSILPNIIGTSQFPKPPIIIGITMKKIIINACAVTRTL